MSGNNGGFITGSHYYPPPDDGGGFVLNGKIMLSAIVVLFFVVILMFSLHLYARWYLLRSRRRHHHSRNVRRNSRRTQLVFYVNPNSNAASAATRGLDARVLMSLPVFTFSCKTNPDTILECAVCLSEFEENESGRRLPKCNHSFHLECIDMWFHSHSTCPLCRTPVEESVPVSDNQGELVLTINESSGGEFGSNQGSDLCATCQQEEGQAGTSTVGSGKKLSIEVPRRNIEGFEGQSSGCDSGPSQAYRSPMGRMLSFKRILSRDWRGSGASPCISPIHTASCVSITVTEPDIEQGDDRHEIRQTQG